MSACEPNAHGPRKAGVVIASTRAAAGIYTDETGPIILDWLKEHGFDTFPTMETAWHAIGQHAYALAVIDRGLPDGDGLDLVRRMLFRVVLETGAHGERAAGDPHHALGGGRPRGSVHLCRVRHPASPSHPAPTRAPLLV